MNSTAYERLYETFESHLWIVPYYKCAARSLVFLGVGLFSFLAYIILKKTRSLNREFARALFYTLLTPTLISVYIGGVCLPNFIIPYDIVWAHGFFQIPEATQILLISFSFFCVPYITSLIYLGIIYMKAFFKHTHFDVGKSLQILLGSLTIVFIMGGCILTYSSFGYKQDWKRSIVIQGNLNNTKVFDEYGGFVINMIEAPPTIWVAVGMLLAENAVAIAIIAPLVTKVWLTLHSRKQTLSKMTFGLQRMLICVFVIHVIIFVWLYGLPCTIVFLAMYFKETQLSSYPVGVICMLNLCIMPTVYCITYLYFVSPIRHAFARLVRGSRGLRRVSVVSSRREFSTGTAQTNHTTNV